MRQTGFCLISVLLVDTRRYSRRHAHMPPAATTRTKLELPRNRDIPAGHDTLTQ